jgi:hypothetical protein
MGCSICESLERTYLLWLNEYREARSSAGYRVSTKLAAHKNVEMERARYELEEHRLVCGAAIRVPLRIFRFATNQWMYGNWRLKSCRRVRFCYYLIKRLPLFPFADGRAAPRPSLP